MLIYSGIILFCVITFGGSSDPDARCPAYRIFTKFEEECQYNMFQATTIAHLQLEESGTVNGSDVIQLISRDCENRKSDYITCAESLMSRCPVADQAQMFKMVRNNQATYCEGAEVNNWIVRFVARGFKMDSACLPRIQDAAERCYNQNQPLDFDPNTSSLDLAYYLSRWQLEKMLPCTFQQLQQTDTPAGCTSSWIDQAFYLWVFKENRQPLSHLNLGQRRRFLEDKGSNYIDVDYLRTSLSGK